jgi:di/tricarboxylate transporter
VYHLRDNHAMTDFSLLAYLSTATGIESLPIWFGGLLVLTIMVVLAREWAPPDFVMLGAAITAALVGLITPTRVFEGFADTSMLTVAALYVVAAAVRETGGLERLGGWILGRATTERQAMWRMSLSVTPLSGFMNNTPLVAMMIPVLQGWCKKHNVAPSKVLMPLSMFTVLGGTCTLVGTSTNLVVQGLLKRNDLPQMSMFDLTWVGLPLAIVGGAYLLFIGSRWLPERRDLLEQFGANRREFLVNLRIEPGCRMAGQTVEAAGLRHLKGLFLVEILREGEVITPVRPDRRLEVADILTFTGLVDTIVELEKIPGLVPAGEMPEEQPGERELHEAVISSTSPLVGQSIRDSEFRATYNAAVLAVHRGGERLKGRVGDIVLRPGDTLLLQTGPHFDRAHRNNADFYLVSPVQDARPVRHERAWLALGILGLLVGMLSWGVPPVIAAFVAAGLALLTRCIAPNVARQSLDLQTLVTIAASFGVSEALEASGFVKFTAEHVVSAAQGLGPVAILLAIYLMTSLMTEVLTNTAAAALMFPFAIATATQMHVSHWPFVMAVTYAASLSFLTPIGYQTNLMVYGPGGYKFTDFTKIGAPLNLLLTAMVAILLPIFWPF